jgi:hypothetical protein
MLGARLVPNFRFGKKPMHAASLSMIIRRVRRLWFQYQCRARSTSPSAGEKTLQQSGLHMIESQIRPPNKSLQATAAMRCRFTSDWSHTAVVAGASAMPAAVPELGR